MPPGFPRYRYAAPDLASLLEEAEDYQAALNIIVAQTPGVVGEGLDMDAIVYAHPTDPNQVIKASASECFENFLRMVQAEANVHLPQVYATVEKDMEWAGASGTFVFMERLDPLTPQGFDALDFESQLALVYLMYLTAQSVGQPFYLVSGDLDVGEIETWLDQFDLELDSDPTNSSAMESLFADYCNSEVCRAARLVREYRKQCRWDLHPQNAMLRGNVLVFTDPYR